MCIGEYGGLPAAFYLTCKGCFHRSQMHRLQYATEPGLVVLEDGSEPAVSLVRGVPPFYVARAMRNDTVEVLDQIAGLEAAPEGFMQW